MIFRLTRGFAMYFMILLLIGILPISCSRSPPSQHPPWRSKSELSERPYSERQGNTIILNPSQARFQIPQVWIEWYQEFKNNLHLFYGDLDSVAVGYGEWHTEFASVCNAALPFDRCAFQAGEEGWGREGVSFSTLHMRVYDIAESVEGTVRWIKKKGTSDIRRITKKSADMEHSTKEQSWQRIKLGFDLFYYDYGAKAQVDFWIRRYGSRTLVLVFMYTDKQSHEHTINSIIDSFRVP